MSQKATQKVGAGIYDKDLKLGGAVRSDVRQLDLYTPAPDTKRVLWDAAKLSGPPRPPAQVHGVVDMISRNQLGWHTFGPLHTSEAEFHTSLMESVSGRGASGDHPTVQKAVAESLKHHPRILTHYMNA